MRTVQVWLLLPLACTLLTASAFMGEKNVEFSVDTYHMPDDCTNQILLGDSGLFSYQVFFLNGTMFDSSTGRGYLGHVQVGSPDVAKGYSMGIVGMCVGEKRRIVVPYDLAYGEKGLYPVIPPYTDLEFHTELARILDREEEF